MVQYIQVIINPFVIQYDKVFLIYVYDMCPVISQKPLNRFLRKSFVRFTAILCEEGETSQKEIYFLILMNSFSSYQPLSYHSRSRKYVISCRELGNIGLCYNVLNTN